MAMRESSVPAALTHGGGYRRALAWAEMLAPRLGAFWRWWGEALLAWLPTAIRERFGLWPQRLLLRVAGDQLRVSVQCGQAHELGALALDELALADGTLLDPVSVRLPITDSVAHLPHWLLLPETVVLRRRLRLPATAAERLHEITAFEIDRQTPFSAADVVHDARLLAMGSDRQMEAELIGYFEARADKDLHPAQIERLYINVLAYANGLMLSAIQATAEKMLVRTSSGVFLDYLGELVGTPRLPAASAQTRITFILNEPADPPTVIPAGTLIASSDGRVSFATDEAVNVGANPVTVTATCTEPGAQGNGWLPGQINALQSGPPVTASNITISAGGADTEGDDRYRQRIMSAPEAYTNAGSYGAYRHHAMSAHQSIVDIAVYGPSEGEPPGQVALYPLTE